MKLCESIGVFNIFGSVLEDFEVNFGIFGTKDYNLDYIIPVALDIQPMKANPSFRQESLQVFKQCSTVGSIGWAQ